MSLYVYLPSPNPECPGNYRYSRKPVVDLTEAEQLYLNGLEELNISPLSYPDKNAEGYRAICDTLFKSVRDNPYAPE